MPQDITFQSGDRLLSAYVARPEVAPARAPGVLVLHEILGLTQGIRAVADRFARAGYVAAAVDLFAGQSRAVCMTKMLVGTVHNTLDHQGVRDTRRALEVLSELDGVDPERLGAVGFCLGGTLAVAVACTDERVRAIAPYYGFNPKPLEAVRRSCPVVGSFPEQDFTRGAGLALEAELTVAGIPNDIKVYPGARHSFATPGATFDPVASVDAWNRVMAFFDEHVVGVSQAAQAVNPRGRPTGS